MSTLSQSYLEARMARENKLEVVITLRHNEQPGQPSSAPKDWNKYRKFVTDTIQSCQPAVVTVEYKEASYLHYRGFPEEYHRQLDVVSKIAHKNGALIANGGFDSDLVSLLYYRHLLRAGKEKKATKFLTSALDPIKQQMFLSKQTEDTMQKMYYRAKTFLEVYKNSDIDYINIHWSIKDPQALSQAAHFIRKETKKNLISTEIKKPETAEETEALMKKITRLGFPCVIWYFGIEKPNAEAVSRNGRSLQTDSQVFAHYIKKKFINQPMLRNTAILS